MSARPDVVAVAADADATRAIAGEVAALARAGDVVLLAGGLGAGKTTFTQGFGRALGITDEPITSPTFTLMRDYRGGRVRLLHLDVYRLDHLQEVVDLGLAELVDEGAIAIVEWGDAAAPALPADHLDVRLDFGSDDDERRLAFTQAGGAWRDRIDDLADALAPWAAP